ncbi:MAG: AI-2E family transporter [Paludibacteraceae bacterium]|nr:AI-2E family transporter [Paludibacteraceae bacterium]
MSVLYGVLLPFFVSYLLAYMLDPVVEFVQTKCRVGNRAVSVIITLLLIVGLFAAIFAVVIPEAKAQAVVAKEAFVAHAADFDINNYLSAETQAKLKDQNADWSLSRLLEREDVMQSVKEFVPKLMNWISGGISWLGGLFSAFIGVLYLVFLMIDMPNIRANWSRFVPRKFRPQALSIAEKVDENMSAYFRGQVTIACCVGILFAVGFSLIGLPMGIIMGFIVGLLNLVPYMQALSIPPVLLLAVLQGFTTDRPIWLCLVLAVVVYVVVQTIQDMILTPRIMGDAMGLSPAMILLALSFWGALMGIIGMIIALPMTTLIIYYYDRYVVNRGVTSRAHQDNYQGRLRQPKA